MLSPRTKKTNLDKLRKDLDKTRGIFKDYTVEEISPLRKKGAWGNFGKWDEDLEVDNSK